MNTKESPGTAHTVRSPGFPLYNRHSMSSKQEVVWIGICEPPVLSADFRIEEKRCIEVNLVCGPGYCIALQAWVCCYSWSSISWTFRCWGSALTSTMMV